ncbi:hypothetical protein ACFLZV_07180, partial [Candidatus Margulisiibacteriota bacterium]
SDAGVHAGRDSRAVLELLMPEFLIQDESSSEGSSKTRQVLEDIGVSQVNALFRRQLMRPLEKQLAKNIGLYDLKVNYNVGRALLSNISEDSPGEENFGVDLITNLLSDQLFVRVRTNLEASSEESQSDTFIISGIELTYYIWSSLSISYSNIRENKQVRHRSSLKYRYEF